MLRIFQENCRSRSLLYIFRNPRLRLSLGSVTDGAPGTHLMHFPRIIEQAIRAHCLSPAEPSSSFWSRSAAVSAVATPADRLRTTAGFLALSPLSNGSHTPAQQSNIQPESDSSTAGLIRRIADLFDRFSSVPFSQNFFSRGLWRDKKLFSEF